MIFQMILGIVILVSAHILDSTILMVLSASVLGITTAQVIVVLLFTACYDTLDESIKTILNVSEIEK